MPTGFRTRSQRFVFVVLLLRVTFRLVSILLEAFCLDMASLAPIPALHAVHARVSSAIVLILILIRDEHIVLRLVHLQL